MIKFVIWYAVFEYLLKRNGEEKVLFPYNENFPNKKEVSFKYFFFCFSSIIQMYKELKGKHIYRYIMMFRKIMPVARNIFWVLVLWCLTQLSTIFQLYRGGYPHTLFFL
jgi:Na+/alanine symporter